MLTGVNTLNLLLGSYARSQYYIIIPNLNWWMQLLFFSQHLILPSLMCLSVISTLNSWFQVHVIAVLHLFPTVLFHLLSVLRPGLGHAVQIWLCLDSFRCRWYLTFYRPVLRAGVLTTYWWTTLGFGRFRISGIKLVLLRRSQYQITSPSHLASHGMVLGNLFPPLSALILSGWVPGSSKILTLLLRLWGCCFGCYHLMG